MDIRNIGGVDFQILKSHYPDTQQLMLVLINLGNDKPIVLSTPHPEIELAESNHFIVKENTAQSLLVKEMEKAGYVKYIHTAKPYHDTYCLVEPVTGKSKKKDPEHPGLILRRDFLKAKGISQTAFCDLAHMGWNSVNKLITGKRGIAFTMAYRLSKLFPDTTPHYWVNLQTDYDIWRFKKGIFANKLEKDTVEIAKKTKPLRSIEKK